MRNRLLFAASLLLFFSFAAARAQEIPAGLTEASSAIREKLTDLKVQSANMTALCETLYGRLETSQAELAQWREQSTMLSDSLMNINEQLNSSYAAIVVYEHKLKITKRILVVLLTVIFALLGAKLVAYALYFKGVPLPRWLDILL